MNFALAMRFKVPHIPISLSFACHIASFSLFFLSQSSDGMPMGFNLIFLQCINEKLCDFWFLCWHCFGCEFEKYSSILDILFCTNSDNTKYHKINRLNKNIFARIKKKWSKKFNFQWIYIEKKHTHKNLFQDVFQRNASIRNESNYSLRNPCYIVCANKLV